ncbi:hypothetical protein CC80DRAFT_589037 [Byssothecium circinans]|uniref:Uncharacterized protein n=1 Tax=Byssothecium circinans TaxID=147558 RepID=A0A6A5UDY1_9PLEO|nr:hypothetical protein CC80DRAFT_589037 [Byssothecium circinans]
MSSATATMQHPHPNFPAIFQVSFLSTAVHQIMSLTPPQPWTYWLFVSISFAYMYTISRILSPTGAPRVNGPYLLFLPIVCAEIGVYCNEYSKNLVWSCLAHYTANLLTLSTCEQVRLSLWFRRTAKRGDVEAQLEQDSPSLLSILLCMEQ